MWKLDQRAFSLVVRASLGVSKNAKILAMVLVGWHWPLPQMKVSIATSLSFKPLKASGRCCFQIETIEAKILSPMDSVPDLPAALVEAGLAVVFTSFFDDSGIVPSSLDPVDSEIRSTLFSGWLQVQSELQPASWPASLMIAWSSCKGLKSQVPFAGFNLMIYRFSGPALKPCGKPTALGYQNLSKERLCLTS